MPTLGLYIQFPFCASKCSFCNFSSQVAPASVFEAYCAAVERETERLPAIYEAADVGPGEPADPSIWRLMISHIGLPTKLVAWCRARHTPSME